MTPPKEMLALHIPSFLPSSSPLTTLHPTTQPLPQPSQSQILIRTTHVSPQAVDILYARGAHQNNNPRHGHVHPPFVLGLDFAGVVVVSAPSSSGFKPGEKVVGSALGAFAEYVAVPVGDVRRVPRDVLAREAVAGVGGVVAFAAVVHVAQVRKGETVLVTGVPGGLGVVAVQVARARGARVFVLARNGERAEMVRRRMEGVEVLAADGEWVKRVKELTGGRGVDVVVDNVGVVEDGLRCLRFGGRIVLVGFAGRKGIMEKVAMNKVLLKGATVVGYRYGEALRQGQGPSAEELWSGYAELLEKGAIRPIIDERQYCGLESVGQAMHDMEQGNVFGKAVISLDEKSKAML
ncbi:hypothetical protein MBLNU457_4426t1 [Dothideomycetes sp. NU457]